ncbi:hypothetical protein KOR34_00740 [Posidoniimonas corsicana]|uniref:Uncharacterized protein n=1 Tax=Posidoniimonas corsicana TaxID=1938618 RepID=A0A5C5V9A1_9BACT|nr:hypothetical protein KOR34_00740 [Posidoniimonas corsicana]
MPSPTQIHPQEAYIRQLPDGSVLEAEVSPCSFIYSDYPLQLKVTLRLDNGAAGGVVYPTVRGLSAAAATKADVRSLLDTVQTVPCSRCTAPAFDPTAVATNRSGLCESCYMGHWTAEFERRLDEQRRQLAQQDSAQKAAGMRFRASAWIHGPVGDDKQVDWYFCARPSDYVMQQLLRDAGCEALDDYEIIPL